MAAHDNDAAPEQLRDETTVARKRDEVLARRLADAFDELGRTGTGKCLDAEQIAAYNRRGSSVAGALTPEEAAVCENHFAACSRCRKILAVLAAGSAEVPLAEMEVARLGELARKGESAPARVPRTEQPAASVERGRP